VGRIGESIAARFLAEHGLDLVARNLEVGGGEIDILARDGSSRVVAEVRTTTGKLDDPIDAVNRAKRARVRRLARLIGATRVDFIGVGIGDRDVVIHWVPGA
jgi:putative endonuclease